MVISNIYVIFIFSLYNNKINSDLTATVEYITYGTAVGLAFVWSILNYSDHIKVNVLLRKYDNIDIFVDNLVMNKQEKKILSHI